MTMLRYLMGPMIETDLYLDTVVVRYVYYYLDREEHVFVVMTLTWFVFEFDSS